MTSEESVRIVILNYNGEELLPQCLPSILHSARSSQFNVKVAILDNGSTDQGLDYVRSQFPEIEITLSPNNFFLCSYNDYLKNISDPYVILLNNDIRADDNFIDPLIQKLKSCPENFLAAPQVLEFSGSSISIGRSKAGISFGLFWCSGKFPGYEKEVNTPSDTYSSGFGAFNRNLFCKLGGYDPRFLPGIQEDVDLCYRAHKMGFHLYYEPKSKVFHVGQATFKKAFGVQKLSILAHRNNFLFMWKNFKSLGFWISHLFWMPFRLIFAALTGRWNFLAGFFEALKLHSKPAASSRLS